MQKLDDFKAHGTESIGNRIVFFYGPVLVKDRWFSDRNARLDNSEPARSCLCLGPFKFRWREKQLSWNWDEGVIPDPSAVIPVYAVIRATTFIVAYPFQSVWISTAFLSRAGNVRIAAVDRFCVQIPQDLLTIAECYALTPGSCAARKAAP